MQEAAAVEAPRPRRLAHVREAARPGTRERCFVPVNRLPRDYSREPTILDPQTVHALVRELLDHANANQTWGLEVAETLVDLIAGLNRTRFRWTPV